jgi:hypothetical protein
MRNDVALEDPGFTPGRAELEWVFEVYLDSDERLAKLAERALLRSGLPAASAAMSMLERLSPAAKCRIHRFVGRVEQNQHNEDHIESLLSGLEDPAAEVQRAAIVALGKQPREHLRSFPVEARLLELLSDAKAPERRALVEALGKIGSKASADALDNVNCETEFEFQQLQKARLSLARFREQISEHDTVLFDVPLEEPFTLSLNFRSGLSRIVADQLRPELRAEPDGPTRLRVRHFRGPLSQCFRSRSMLEPSIELPLERADSESAQLDRIVELITCERIVRLLERLSSTRPRLRFTVAGEGHRRAYLWALSERLHAATNRLSANPKSALWEVRIELGEQSRLFLAPRLYEDPRFVYRAADISGASHPTIAAALAHVLGVRDNDIIWDPFTGSGLELIERGLLGSYQELIGTDVDHDALDAAQLNVQRAGLSRVRLLPVDARSACPRGVTGIVTNPPLGARHVRTGMLADLLLDFLTNARRWLGPGGRLVWLSPMPARTAEHARSLGFAVERGGPIDLSGLTPELQVFRVPEVAPSRWRS